MLVYQRVVEPQTDEVQNELHQRPKVSAGMV
jgi:hypothetical protein